MAGGLGILADPLIAEVEREFGPCGRLRLQSGRAIARADLADCQVLLVRSVTRVDGALLAGSPVRFVGSATAGIDHVDLEFLQAHGIAFAHAPGSNAAAVAEYVLAAALALRAGAPASWSIGVIGCGQAGGAVLELFGALGAHCLAHDPPRARRLHDRTYVDLDAALAADIVSLHVPLTLTGADRTCDLLDARRIGLFAPGTVLINAARGGVLDETALLARLTARDDLRVALDCWCSEPRIDPALLAAVDLATPHIAGHTEQAKLRGTRMLKDAFERWRAGALPATSGAVPPARQAATGPRLPAGVDARDPRALRAFVRRHYDIEADARALRAAPGDPAGLAAHFDACRADRRRQEFLIWRETAQ